MTLHREDFYTMQDSDEKKRKSMHTAMWWMVGDSVIGGWTTGKCCGNAHNKVKCECMKVAGGVCGGAGKFWVGLLWWRSDSMLIA